MDTGATQGRLCLVTGASGYIGGRAGARTAGRRHRVRCMARPPGGCATSPGPGGWRSRRPTPPIPARPAVPWRAWTSPTTSSTRSAAEGASPRTTAARPARSPTPRRRRRGRLVYLGGMDPEEELSPHLRSRAEVGEIMLAGGVPAAWLRAAVIIGSGSASFEMLRYLTERLPVMVTPHWVHTRIQPIAIRDVLHYLVRAADLPADVNRGFDIGGPDVLTYTDMMRRYAAVAGLRRRIIVPVPVLSPRLSSLWVGAITPVPGALARPSWSRCGTRWSAARTTSPNTCPRRPADRSASTGRWRWRCAASGRPASPPAGRRPPPRAPPATRCPPTRTGRRKPLHR